MSKFSHLLDSDSDGYESEDEGDGAIPTVAPVSSKFDGLLESDEEEDEQHSIESSSTPLSRPPPPPPPPAKSQKQKKGSKSKDAADDPNDDDIEFFEQLAKQTKETQKRNSQLPSAIHQKRLQLNIAHELSERYNDTSFDDSTKLPKNAPINKFIVKRRLWPNFCPSSFHMNEIEGQRYLITLSEFGENSKDVFNVLQKRLDVEAMIYRLKNDQQYNVFLLMGMARYYLFRNEFTEATDLVLRLSFVIQQQIIIVPPKFSLGEIKFVSNTDLYDIIAFVARFAFRRGCYETSTDFWKFAISVVEADDPNCFLLCGAVPALFSEDLEFVQSILSDKELTFRGVPVSYIPDWQIIESILLIEKDPTKIEKMVNLWEFVFANEDEIGLDKMPTQLQRICVALKRRIKPFLDKEDVAFALADAKSKKVDVEEERKQIYAMWNKFTEEIDVSLIVEEDALPVNTENA